MRALIALFVVAVALPAAAGTPEVAWTTPLDAPSFGSASVADIDGDGRLEIAFGTYFGDDSVRVLNGEDGSEYWRYRAGRACLDASCRFADLDGDGVLELVVGVSNQGAILCFDAKSGDLKWRYQPSPVECTDSPPAILDVDGDGTRDFVIATFKGDNHVHAICGKTRKPIWSHEVPGKHPGMYHGVSVGDLVGNGKPELTIAAYDGKVRCLDARSGKLHWVVDPADTFIMSPTVIADLTGDGKPEVISASSHVTAISRKGKILWSKMIGRTANDSALRGVSVADLDGDGKPDVAALAASGMFRVFRGKDGKVLFELDATTLTDQPVGSSHHGVTIADLTGDGRLDVFFVVGHSGREEKSGLAVCLTGFAGKGRGWTMLRHDPQNTGNAATALPVVLRQHIEGLTPARKAIMKPARPPKTDEAKAKAPVRRTPAAPAKKKLDVAALHAEAIQRGIPPAVLDDVIAANVLRPTAEARAKAIAHGRPAFLAACLLIEAGHGATFTDPILAGTYEAGLEKTLLAMAKGPELPGWGTSAALRNLGVADTPEVREYLLTRLVTERNPSHFFGAALALGKLREARAVRIIARQLLAFEDRWRGVEPYLVTALSGAGGKAANEWILRYVADPRARSVVHAIHRIAQTDPDLSSREAARVLDSGRELSEAERKSLERLRK